MALWPRGGDDGALLPERGGICTCLGRMSSILTISGGRKA